MKRLTAVLLASLLACSDGTDATLAKQIRSIDGTWVLESVNGSPLPATTVAGTEMLGSSLVAQDASFTITSVVRTPGGGASPQTIVESGDLYCGHAYCRPELLIVRANGASADALVDGTSLTLTRVELGELVYRRL